jgi:gliding motility associated protien GldN
MRKEIIFGCIYAALSFFALTPQLVAQADDAANEQTNKKVRDGIYRTDINQRLPLAYPHLEERDVLWEKRIWREINIKEMRNHHFAYEKRHFITLLFDALKNKKISAYSTVNDEFTEEIPYADLLKIIEKCDTIQLTDPETGITEDVPIKNDFDPKSIVRYRIKEVVYFDSKLGRMNVRIIGIAPIMNRYDNQGNFVASAPLCWFYYNDIRPVLAKEAIFLAQTDTKNMSWDDVFESRLFSSYITKESNVKDARLQDLYSGINILYESEKIKEGVRNFEADLFPDSN